jgi:hypothetical protein
MGVDPQVLAAEVEAYNAAAAAGRDAFGKTVFPSGVDPQAAVHVALITPVVHYTMVSAPRLPAVPPLLPRAAACCCRARPGAAAVPRCCSPPRSLVSQRYFTCPTTALAVSGPAGRGCNG